LVRPTNPRRFNMVRIVIDAVVLDEDTRYLRVTEFDDEYPEVAFVQYLELPLLE
jgi:hypothetical protein